MLCFPTLAWLLSSSESGPVWNLYQCDQGHNRTKGIGVGVEREFGSHHLHKLRASFSGSHYTSTVSESPSSITSSVVRGQLLETVQRRAVGPQPCSAPPTDELEVALHFEEFGNLDYLSEIQRDLPECYV